jgi:hypothetical protein
MALQFRNGSGWRRSPTFREFRVFVVDNPGYLPTLGASLARCSR